jgi:hypothetical protein
MQMNFYLLPLWGCGVFLVTGEILRAAASLFVLLFGIFSCSLLRVALIKGAHGPQEAACGWGDRSPQSSISSSILVCDSSAKKKKKQNKK